jgi:hypothetical protein
MSLTIYYPPKIRRRLDWRMLSFWLLALAFSLAIDLLAVYLVQSAWRALWK